MSIPSEYLNNIFGLALEKDTFISVFSTYSKDVEAYFLDKIMYNNESPDDLLALNNNTYVRYHYQEHPINLSKYQIPSMRIDTSSKISNYIYDEDEIVINSAIGDNPVFLQEDLDIINSRFILQFVGSDFPEDYQDVLYMSDAVGYLFIETELTINSRAGVFFGQCS